MVIFSDTRLWVPARIERVSEDADLALLQVEVAGPFPTVQGVSSVATRTRVGSPVAIIGYPLGTNTPMEGSGTRITARSTLGVGTLSKSLANIVQIDAYAGEGSSGSPVFDAAGNVIAVVFGGAREAQNRIVYAVPSDQLIPMLPIEARALLR
jgi:S1-C subfamily serine protease